MVNEHIIAGNSGRLYTFVSTVYFLMFTFAFAPKLLVVTGREIQNPRQNLLKARIHYFYCLVIFYVLGAITISIIIPSNDPRLLGGGSSASASP